MTPQAFSIDTLLERVADRGRLRPPRHRGVGAAAAHRGRLAPLEDSSPSLRRRPRPSLSRPFDRAAEAARDRPAGRLLLFGPGPRPLPRQRLLPARQPRRRLPPRAEVDQVGRRSSAFPRRSASSRRAARPRPRDRPDRLRQVDDARGDDRPINETRPMHIVTIEDPIEFLHQHKSSVVNQREIGADTTGFADALRDALRQDPDVILVGEMRDLETISTALTAAETGHLVFATLHTQSAPRRSTASSTSSRPSSRARCGSARRFAPGDGDADTPPERGRPRARPGARGAPARRRRPEPGSGRARPAANLFRDADKHDARHADDGTVPRRARRAQARSRRRPRSASPAGATNSRRSSPAAASHPAPMTTFPRPSAVSESQEPDQ